MRTQLSTVLDDGEKLVTADGRDWAVTMGGMLTAREWRPGSFIDVDGQDDPSVCVYRLTNLTTGVSVSAVQLH